MDSAMTLTQNLKTFPATPRRWADVERLFCDVRKDFRRQGVASTLLSAAVEFAKKQGAKIVEGYPVEPSNDRMPDPFLWHGVPSAFKAAGFQEVLRRSKSRPIMRYLVGNSMR